MLIRSRLATRFRSASRAVAPLAGVLLVAITVLLAGGVVTAALDAPAEPAPTATFSLSAEGTQLTLTHEGGDPVPVDDLTVHVSVNDEPLARQPPVPFFSASGFRPGPNGPFNTASDDEWVVGGSASFAVAGTNEPTPGAGDVVEIRLSVREQPIATMRATVDPG
ncbi:hypothetical protein J2751_001357 [Halorubrum alkaliphilum]|uniref:Archaeal Type IV pilin N-terminal domain-containing protein n=1 Tax=Halorubrum alkaliphilum TaxID=261290 RepID=A0A8T4GF34_9EURY|nr:type IV pilin N-terminal domain-containing protein [Halorubrum alkaliphilum]MBP1922349.1 hypothetical protein [Halorubrum alkaliphilum]